MNHWNVVIYFKNTAIFVTSFAIFKLLCQNLFCQGRGWRFRKKWCIILYVGSNICQTGCHQVFDWAEMEYLWSIYILHLQRDNRCAWITWMVDECGFEKWFPPSLEIIHFIFYLLLSNFTCWKYLIIGIFPWQQWG